jgi:hypothetical protein
VHGNETEHGKGAIQRTAMRNARQRDGTAHGKEHQHGKERTQRRAKNKARQRLATAHGKEQMHPFAVRKQAFSFFSFLFYSFYYLCLFLS